MNKTTTKKPTAAEVAEAAEVAANPFAKFMQHKQYKAHIKSLDYEITYRKLTMDEDDEYNLRLLAGMSKENQNLNIKAGSEIKYEKIAKVLIDPVVTVEQLKSMDSDAGKVIVEILAIVEKSEMVDKEGNSKD